MAEEVRAMRRLGEQKPATCAVHADCQTGERWPVEMEGRQRRVSTEHYESALRCKRCDHFLLAHDVAGHERWHEEPNR